MSLNHAAEQILFGEKFEDKLVNTLQLDDPPILSALPSFKVSGHPELPGRPAHLMMGQGKKSLSFPSLIKLEKDHLARGHVLHFLANHELLALELMALALLKFPKAPRAFRSMIAHTMSEEQEHLKLYVNRMNDFGVGFGELSLNDYFWKMISKMDCPEQYLAWMSMTFEQANLDFSRHYQDLFYQLDDRETHSLMKVVYEDEIGHLGGGIRWFKQFTQTKDLWKTWSHYMRGHINIVRAKGKPFDVEGRKLAGLDEQFIQKIWVYQKSRGRTPQLAVWNAGEEIEITGASLKGKAKDLQLDLDVMAMDLVADDDCVLLKSEPHQAWLNWRKAHAFKVPQYMTCEDNPAEVTALFSHLKPWVWTPSSSLKELQLKHIQIKNQATFSYEDFTAYHSKVNWKKALAKFWKCKKRQEKFNDCIHFDDLDLFKIIDSVESFYSAWEFHSKLPCVKVVLQSEYSMSGHHLKILEIQQGTSPALLTWVKSMLVQGKKLIMEPFFGGDDNFNLSLLYTEGQLRPAGISHFYTQNGKYRGHWIGPVGGQMPQLMREQVFRFIQPLQHAMNELARDWMGDLMAPCGIDCLIYRMGDQWKIHPGLELNPRWTMGHLALEFQSKIKPQCVAKWLLSDKARVPNVNQIWDDQLHSVPVGAVGHLLGPGKYILNDLSQSKTWVSLLEVVEHV